MHREVAKKFEGHIAARREALAFSDALWYHIAALPVKDALGAGSQKSPHAKQGGGLFAHLLY